MVYWLSIATALPVATFVSLWMAVHSKRLGYDTIVLCWIVGIWGGGLFGLIFYNDGFNPLPSVLISAVFPPLIWLRLEKMSTSSLERGPNDFCWTMGFLIGVSMAALAVLVSGPHIRRLVNNHADDLPSTLYLALMAANGFVLLLPVWAVVSGYRRAP